MAFVVVKKTYSFEINGRMTISPDQYALFSSEEEAKEHIKNVAEKVRCNTDNYICYQDEYSLRYFARNQLSSFMNQFLFEFRIFEI